VYTVVPHLAGGVKGGLRAYTLYRVANPNNVGGSSNSRVKAPDETLRRRLSEAEEYLKVVLEDYEATTEELRSSQEELTCANDELENLNRDLLAAKEMSLRVNSELRIQKSELERNRNELASMLRSAGVAILMLGMDLRLRRFTPQAEVVFHLREGDVGKPLREILTSCEAGSLESACSEVLENLQPRRRFAGTATGRRLALWIRPYRNSDRRIDGVVILVLDAV
jgi:two-component system CheB/CheR fusion protein